MDKVLHDQKLERMRREFETQKYYEEQQAQKDEWYLKNSQDIMKAGMKAPYSHAYPGLVGPQFMGAPLSGGLGGKPYNPMVPTF